MQFCSTIIGGRVRLNLPWTTSHHR